MRPDEGGGETDFTQPVTSLLPGDAAAVLALGQAFVAWSQLCSSTVAGLSTIDPTWSGEARAAYQVKSAVHLDDWRKASRAFDKAGAALVVYAGKLATAQGDVISAKAVAGADAADNPTKATAARLYGVALADATSAASTARQLVDEAIGLLPKVEEVKRPDATTVVVAAVSPGFAVGKWLWDHKDDALDSLSRLANPATSTQAKQDLVGGMGRGIVDLLLLGGDPNSPVKTVMANNLDYWERWLGINPNSKLHAVGEFVGPMFIPIPGLGEAGAAGGTAARATEIAASRAAVRQLATDVTRIKTPEGFVEVLGGKAGHPNVWGLGPSPRGFTIEGANGGNLPYGFKTFDKVDDLGEVATSMKSMNLADKTYLDRPSQIYSKTVSYLRTAANFTGASKGGMTIDGAALKARVVELYIPLHATPEQYAQLARVRKFVETDPLMKEKHVVFVVKEVS